jgi:hypothetical protein
MPRCMSSGSTKVQSLVNCLDLTPLWRVSSLRELVPGKVETIFCCPLCCDERASISACVWSAVSRCLLSGSPSACPLCFNGTPPWVMMMILHQMRHGRQDNHATNHARCTKTLYMGGSAELRQFSQFFAAPDRALTGQACAALVIFTLPTLSPGHSLDRVTLFRL